MSCTAGVAGAAAAARGRWPASLALALRCGRVRADFPPGPPVREVHDVAAPRAAARRARRCSATTGAGPTKRANRSPSRAGPASRWWSPRSSPGATRPARARWPSCSRSTTASSARGVEAQFLVVTLDPANDTPAVLQHFKTESGLPEAWHLLAGNINDTRDLRDLLGIHVIDDGPHLLHDGRILVFDEHGRRHPQLRWLLARRRSVAVSRQGGRNL